MARNGGYNRDAGGNRIDGLDLATREVNVALRSRVGTGLSNGSDTSQTSRLRWVLCGGVVTIRLVFANFYLPAGGTEPVNGSDVTVRASIENPAATAGDPSGAAVIPVFFSGQRAGTMQPGATLVSDPIYVNAADMSAIFVRSYASVAAGGRWVNVAGTGSGATANFDGGGVSEGVITGSDLSDSGAINGTSSAAFGPVAILGTPRVARRSFLIVGDSIAMDTGVVRTGQVGYLTRAAINAQSPALRIAEGGERALTVVQQMNYWKRARLTRYATDALVNYGTNDIYGSSRSLAQVKADLLTLWTMLRRAGLRVTQSTILPRPGASTDGYMSVSGQSITDAAKEAIRTGLNSWLRDPAGALSDAGGNLAGVIDPCAVVEVNSAGVLTLNGGRWAVPANPVIRTGTATAVTASTLTDSTAGRTPAADLGLVLAITSAAAGAGQSSTVSANTATAWTFLAALGTTPTGTVQYQLGRSYCYDGTHPTEAAHVVMGDAINVAG